MKIKNTPPFPSVLFAIISVQGGAAIAKSIFPIMGAAGTASLRIVLSAIILLIAFRPNFKYISAKQWKFLIPYGIALGGMNISIYLALARIPLGLAVTLEFMGPLILTFSKSRKSLDFLWAFCASFGVALIAPWSSNNVNVDLIGVLLALLAGAFWAAYIVIGGKTSKIIKGRHAVGIGLLVASFIVIPIALLEGNLSEITPKFFFLGIAVALLSSAIPFSLEMSVLKRISAKSFSILMSLEPAVAAICGLVFLGEQLNFYEWVAILLIVVASIGATFGNKELKIDIERINT